ncbi:MAG TPA: methionine synthase, partial [Terriglobia bacterium]|nr:methionine synthase [Terriglobia bacterium]
GVVDVHTHAMEEEDAVRQRVKKALTILGKDQIWVDPDCGLKTRTVEEAIEKLRLCVAAAETFRS